MYYKCTWCKKRIVSPPVYYTQGFPTLQPGFEVYCNAACSLFAYGSVSKSHIPIEQNSSPKKA